MHIGIMLPQEWERSQFQPGEAFETLTRIAREAERLGFASLWHCDHFHATTSSLAQEKMTFECWTTLAALARETTRIRLGQLVTCNSFRHPALLANMARTLAVLSHGRLTLGLGAGWYEAEYRAYGYPFPDTATRLRQLREALQVIRALWSEERASFAGNSYQVHDAIHHPKGVQQPSIPLLIGGKGEQVTLKLVARYGDACNFTHPTPEEMVHKFARIKRYCQESGRDEREIRRTIYVNGCVGETDAEASEKAKGVPGKFSFDHLRLRGLLGSPATIRRRLLELEQVGVHEVIVSLHDVVSLEPLRLLAQSM